MEKNITKVTIDTFNEKNIIDKYNELCKCNNRYALEFSVGTARRHESFITESETFKTLDEAVKCYVNKTNSGQYQTTQLRWSQLSYNDIYNMMTQNNYDILAEYSPDLHKEEYINKADYLVK